MLVKRNLGGIFANISCFYGIYIIIRKKTLPFSTDFFIFIYMEATITIAEDLYENIMKYTHTSDISDAVDIAVKDWILFQRIREFNNRLADNSISINRRYPAREPRTLKFL